VRDRNSKAPTPTSAAATKVETCPQSQTSATTRLRTQMKPNIIIRMGAPYFDARVRGADGKFVHFNLRRLDKKAQHQFRRELVKAFRISREGN
jgi:hypothetical protein